MLLHKLDTTNSTGQLWYLHGGPSYDDILGVIGNPRFHEQFQGFTIYVPVFRGLKHAGEIKCTDNKVTDACIREAKKYPLKHYTISNGARDINYWMERSQDKSDLYLFGVSFGTLYVVF